MRRLITYFFLLFAVMFANHGDASEHIKTTLANLPRGGLLKAEFTQKRYMQAIAKPIVSQGQILLWDGKGLIWDTKSPFPSSILMTQGGLFSLDLGQKKSLMQGQQKHQEEALMNVMSKLLNGSFDDIDGFTSKSMNASKQGQWSVTLTPPDAIAKFISSIQVHGSKHIAQLTIYRANGDRDEISLHNHKVFDSSKVSQGLTAAQTGLFND
jgi:hypothetical protein